SFMPAPIRHTSDVSQSFRGFVALALRYRYQRIDHLSQDDINNCKRVFMDDYPNRHDFNVAVYKMMLPYEDIVVIEGWRHYTTRAFLQDNCFEDQRDMQINGLILHALSNLSERTPEIKDYLA
ncbi:hypothetical protein BGW38_008446, partial [Lunasporangiospora selenospora]